jgi:hypothetical protein
MQRNTRIQQQCLVGAAKVMLAQVTKAEPAESLLDPPGCVARIARPGQRERLARLGRVREHQGIVGQLHQRQVDLCAVGNASDKAQGPLALSEQQRQQFVIDDEGTPAARGLWFLEPDTVLFRLFERPPNRERLVGDVEIDPSQGQDLASPGSGHGLDGHDREQDRAGALEAFLEVRKQSSQLVPVERNAVVTLAGRWNLLRVHERIA